MLRTIYLGLGVLLCALFVFYSISLPPDAADLLAVWMAGEGFSNGNPAIIYPPDDTVFTMRPDPAWRTLAAEIGHTERLFPFVYPPIWAVLVGWADLSFASFAFGARCVNYALLALIPILSWRALGREMAFLPHAILVTLVMFGTFFGTSAIDEIQPQILVATLTLVFLERLRANAPITAGAALAVAAAIKLYPALLIVIVLARRQYRVAASFAVVGGALAAASIWLAGWPLHVEFLRLIGVISDTGLSLSLSWSFDKLIGQWFFADSLMRISPMMPLGLDPEGGWRVMAKPPVWQAFSKLSLLSMLVVLAIWARRAPDNDAVYPVAMIVLALLSPIAWAYHFIAPVAFAPMLISRLGDVGKLIFIAVFFSLSMAGAGTFQTLGVPIEALTDWATALMLLLAGAMIAAGTREAQSPLHRSDHRL
ncbi:glycosyltransferase family 87 protein [Oceaniglobus ichthyenteri]|uniref:glycosyltransferase family 87 protein n=1 Tax=Oceaniglobus ichthyenteri TaxID=2136177 RepID=UPI0013DE568A|nr:glycosyltransferase family 87 protein [Oceaniglobus ichthyenteri]